MIYNFLWTLFFLKTDLLFSTLFTDPPSVTPMHSTYPEEQSDFSIDCSATPGNPLSFVYYWTLSGDVHFRQNGTTLRQPRISRNQSGTYFCSAVNSYSNGEEGRDSKPLIVDVQCKEMVIWKLFVKMISLPYIIFTLCGDKIMLKPIVTDHYIQAVQFFHHITHIE